jgi:hypothetical protein
MSIYDQEPFSQQEQPEYSMSDTPRSDAVWKEAEGKEDQLFRLINHAEVLERENALLKSQLETTVAEFQKCFEEDKQIVRNTIAARTDSLQKEITSLRRQLEHKDGLLKQELSDWAETDIAIREASRKVLGDYAVDGDTVAVPPVEDIVEKLVGRLEQS